MSHLCTPRSASSCPPLDSRTTSNGAPSPGPPTPQRHASGTRLYGRHLRSSGVPGITPQGESSSTLWTLCAVFTCNPDHVWPSIHGCEQSRTRAPKRQAGCSNRRILRKGRFNDKDPDYNTKNINNGGNSSDNVKIRPTSRSAGRSTSNNSGRSSGSTQRQRGHAYSATSSSSDSYENTTYIRCAPTSRTRTKPAPLPSASSCVY